MLTASLLEQVQTSLVAWALHRGPRPSSGDTSRCQVEEYKVEKCLEAIQMTIRTIPQCFTALAGQCCFQGIGKTFTGYHMISPEKHGGVRECTLESTFELTSCAGLSAESWNAMGVEGRG